MPPPTTSASSQHNTASASAAPIVILGEALADLFPDGAVIGGAPFNVARNLAALGFAPIMITRVGTDALGRQIAAEFDRFGMIKTGLQVDKTLATGTVDVIMVGNSHRFVIAAHSAWDALDPAATAALVARVAPSLIYYGTLAQRHPTARAAIGAALAASSARRFLDVNLRDRFDTMPIVDRALAEADIVKVNDDELVRLLAWFAPSAAAPADRQSAERQANRQAAVTAALADQSGIARLMDRFTFKRLIVTRGADGYVAFDTAGAVIAAGAAPPVTVVDTVGAGDAFSSIVLIGEMLGWPFAQALDRAAQFAAAVCTLRGAVTTEAAFYDRWRVLWGLDVRAADIR